MHDGGSRTAIQKTTKLKSMTTSLEKLNALEECNQIIQKEPQEEILEKLPATPTGSSQLYIRFPIKL